MTKRKFQVGDRVRVAKPFKEVARHKDKVGKISRSHRCRGLIPYNVEFDNGAICPFFAHELEKVE